MVEASRLKQRLTTVQGVQHLKREFAWTSDDVRLS